jgi:Mrp family chromosome partitioning ATPase
MPMADVSILTPLVDGVLMICRAGITETPALQQAIGSLDPSRVLGVVLNDVQP